MFKFLRGSKKQQNTENAGSDADTDQSALETINRVDAESGLEEVLNPLFLQIEPTSPEEFSVPVAEAERLWARFQQLGPNGEQTLPNEAFQQHLFTSDPFARQIWRTFPRDENGNVNFHAFVGVLMWWKTAPLDKKLAGIFKLLNKSQPLDVPVLQQILMSLDSTIDEETANSRAALLVKTLDNKDQGYIDADQWVNWILQLPEDEITKLTKFSIIPEELNIPAPHSRPETEHESTISDELLIDIAGKIGEKDWTPLARELGFTKQEIRDVKKQNPHRSREQIYQILMLWRQKLGRQATVTALELSLSNSGIQT
ncbi:uncharacterized protein LOC111340379 [Stylophora pistillata]|uniref:uncharacterized protein LOC111340379 n=1 Tax=Stylophora pistillata TaxID=50429 RepID=UPI000C041A5F|nr:uncharacterized protein LOC111340379 [Stylophora pistillata]